MQQKGPSRAAALSLCTSLETDDIMCTVPSDDDGFLLVESLDVVVGVQVCPVKSFSELLADAPTASPSAAGSESGF